MTRIVTACLLGMLIAAGCSQQSGKMERFNELTAEADSYARNIEAKQAAIADVLTAYNQTVSKDSRLELSFESGFRLSEHEQMRLAAHIEQESDASCRSILAHVVELNDEIDLLAGQLAEIYTQLPKPYKAQGGEDHYALCLRYLKAEHGLTNAGADSVLTDVPLMADLMEGFDVWCLYDEGAFNTYVARGTACISPACFAMRTQDAAFKHTIARNNDSLKTDIVPNRGIIGSAATPVSLK